MIPDVRPDEQQQYLREAETPWATASRRGPNGRMADDADDVLGDQQDDRHHQRPTDEPSDWHRWTRVQDATRHYANPT